jgi:hypothetical protein
VNKTLIMVLASLPLCAILLCSCASGPQNAETTQTVQEPWGTKTIYKDAAGDIVRIERRGTNDDFLPGACITQFSYDNGERIAKQNLNSQGLLVCNNEGYTLAKFAYFDDPTNEPIVEETFFGQNNQPVVTKSGFAMMTCTENSDGRINTIHFSDFLGKPAPSLWHSVSNVVDVQYYYLQGVTPIVCGVFWDTNGDILDRKQLKGLTSQVTFQTDDDSDYDVPVHIHTGGGSSHGHDNGFHGGHH